MSKSRSIKISLILQIILFFEICQQVPKTKGKQFSLTRNKSTWFQSRTSCNLIGTEFAQQSMLEGWAGGIYLNTNWMHFEGCFQVLFFAGTKVHNFNKSSDADIICSYICRSYVFFAYKEKRCVCYNNSGSNEKVTKENTCQGNCFCGGKFYHKVYRHTQGKPVNDTDQQLRCSTRLKHKNSSFLKAVECTSCKNLTGKCTRVLRKRYLSETHNSTPEDLESHISRLHNFHCLLVRKEEDQYIIVERNCNEQHYGICDIRSTETTNSLTTTKETTDTEVETTATKLQLNSTGTTDDSDTRDLNNSINTESTAYVTTFVPEKDSTVIQAEPTTIYDGKQAISTLSVGFEGTTSLQNQSTTAGETISTFTIDLSSTGWVDQDLPYNLITIVISVAACAILIVFLAVIVMYKRRRKSFVNDKQISKCYFNPNLGSENTEEMVQRDRRVDSLYTYAAPENEYNGSCGSPYQNKIHNTLDGEYNTLNFTMRNDEYQTGISKNPTCHYQKKNIFRKSIDLLRSPFIKKPKNDETLAYSSIRINFHELVYDVPKHLCDPNAIATQSNQDVTDRRGKSEENETSKNTGNKNSICSLPSVGVVNSNSSAAAKNKRQSIKDALVKIFSKANERKQVAKFNETNDENYEFASVPCEDGNC